VRLPPPYRHPNIMLFLARTVREIDLQTGETLATLIQAFSKYGPKIDLMGAADPKRFMELITQRTTLSAGVVKNVQESEVETLIGLLKEGRSVHTGVAIFDRRSTHGAT
jgi:hypothetical protein